MVFKYEFQLTHIWYLKDLPGTTACWKRARMLYLIYLKINTVFFVQSICCYE